MPTFTTTEHGEIRVHHRQVTRMADRLWRLGSPARRWIALLELRRKQNRPLSAWAKVGN